MNPPVRPGTPSRRARTGAAILRYVLGISVLAAMFTIAHLLLYNPNQGAAPGDTDAIVQTQEELNGW